MFPVKKLFISAIVGLNFAGVVLCANAEESTGSVWPTTVVKFEDLHPISDFKLFVPGLVAEGRVTGPTILRAHITTEGTVAKTVLLESCGNSELDEASMHAMRVMRFKPYTFGSVPIEVSLVAPIHVPARFGRSPR